MAIPDETRDRLVTHMNGVKADMKALTPEQQQEFLEWYTGSEGYASGQGMADRVYTQVIRQGAEEHGSTLEK